jgi:hypothetical protein
MLVTRNRISPVLDEFLEIGMHFQRGLTLFGSAATPTSNAARARQQADDPTMREQTAGTQAWSAAAVS